MKNTKLVSPKIEEYGFEMREIPPQISKGSV